jgi:hypothetical protein
MSSGKETIGSYGWCALHKKRGYANRKAAKKARRVFHKGEAVTPYPCTHAPGTFHLGHISAAVQVGNQQRGVYDRPPKPPANPLMMPKQRMSV